MENKTSPICQRLQEVRESHFGPRGKARFARALGIRHSTYDRYEKDRLPPADLLVKAAQITGTRLEWLLTGEEPREEISSLSTDRQEHLKTNLANSLEQLLSQQPELIDHFSELIQTFKQTHQPPAPTPRYSPESTSYTRPSSFSTSPHQEAYIPVVGSTAAGLAHYWQELTETAGGPTADARLERILETYTNEAGSSYGHLTQPVPEKEDSSVHLVQLSRPDSLGFLEFLSSPVVKQKFPDAVAWRIDGESMSPRYQDGDFVITSPSCPAVQGQACVARQQGQIGVNCKIFQQIESKILLIPVNEQYETQEFPADQLVWAWRVLFSIRLR